MPPIIIHLESSTNPVVKVAKGLHGVKARQASGLVWVEGEHAITEAMVAGLVCHQLFLKKAVVDSLALPFSGWVEVAETVYGCSERVMKVLSTTESSVVVAASMRVPDLVVRERALEEWMQGVRQRQKVEEGCASLLLVLDGVQDPGNVGTLVRSAVAFGAGGVLCLPGTADVYSPKVLRASTGLVFRVPVFVCSQAATTVVILEGLEQAGFGVVLADAPKGELEPGGTYKALETQKPLALVLGQEGQGLRLTPEEKQRFASVGVPMVAGVESLNVAVSGSILLAQWHRSTL